MNKVYLFFVKNKVVKSGGFCNPRRFIFVLVLHHGERTACALLPPITAFLACNKIIEQKIKLRGSHKEIITIIVCTRLQYII